MKRTLLVLAFFVAAVAAGLLMRFNLSMPLEHFMQKDTGMALDAPGMGPYDQVGPVGGWAKNEEQMPVGTMPVAAAMEQNKLMFMANNKTDASCCPSAYSSDVGCVCLSGKDTDLLNHRGGNK